MADWNLLLSAATAATAAISVWYAHRADGRASRAEASAERGNARMRPDRRFASMRSKKSTPSCIAFPGQWCKLWREPPTPSMAAVTSHCAAGICASAIRGVGNRFRLGEDVGNSSQRRLEPDLLPFPRLLGAARVSVDASSRKGKLAADKRQCPSEGDKQDQPRKQQVGDQELRVQPVQRGRCVQSIEHCRGREDTTGPRQPSYPGLACEARRK